jgi:glycyl-tRNA synthetase beta subunit
VEDFGAVYDEAGVSLPAHGYGVDKVAEMLQNKRLATLGREVKATAVIAALEAAGAPVRDVIQDGVRRDAALDAFESAKETELRDLQQQSAARVQAIRDEIDGFLRAKNAEIEELKQAAEGAEKAFATLQARKRKEEDRLHEVVAHFIEGADNPITTGPRAAAPSSPPAKPAPTDS